MSEQAAFGGSRSWDAAVIGAGPAGCSAAITLARAGAQVVLVEAARLPRDKLCGEFLSPECADTLAALGVAESIRALHPASIQTVQLDTPDGTTWSLQLPRTAWGLSRRALDSTLAEGAVRAGARVFDETRVAEVRGSVEEGFEVMTSRAKLRARAVIAAHGKRDALDRALGRGFMQQRQPFVALQAHWNGPSLSGAVELHAFPGGYCGLADIEGDRRNLCLLVREPVFRRATAGSGDPIESLLNWMQAQNPRLHEWLAHAERIDERWRSIAQVPFVKKRMVESGILMAGDAGGLIAPVAGDGIAMALDSGMMASQVCLDWLQGRLPSAELGKHYEDLWEQQFRKRFRLAQMLQSVLLEPQLAPLALRLLARVPALGEYLQRETRGVPAEKRATRGEQDGTSYVG